jgi:dolichol-phosphate mannosyltransferase
MFHLKNNIVENTIATTVETDILEELDFDNRISLPFPDRRTSDRRNSDRRRNQTSNIKKITVLIPCYNEEKGIGKVIDGVPIKQLTRLGFQTEIIVINNNSNDHTTKVAKEKGAKVVSEKKQGKGNALKTGFKNISKDTDYVVMLDGDDTYKPKEILRLIEPLENGFCDVIIGSRLEGKLNDHSFSLSHRLANWFFTFFVRRFYLVNTTDTCTGYFAWKKKVVDELAPHIKSDGFAIEVEMITKMAKLGYKIFSVPITYDKREGNSKLSPIMDGIKIVWMLFKNLKWKPSSSREYRKSFSKLRSEKRTK